jgi:asparagine synthase (glutamine-hydrolysing)
MKYIINDKQKNPIILSELLQNRFTKFDDSVVKWKFRDSYINSSTLEKKLVNTYKNNKKNNFSIQKIDYSDWIDIFDEGLKKIKSLNKLPVLFFSGGKDSTFIASRMIQNNIDALYFSFVTSDSEKKVINELADKLKINIFFTKEKLEFIDFENILKKVKEPVLDPAGLSILLLLDICLKNKYKFSDMVFIDGMGNDSYMGHLPGKRELDKLFLQMIFTKLNLQKLISIKLSNSIGKFGDLLRPDYTAHFPGSTIKLDNYYEQISFYNKYKKYKDVVVQRAIQRGIHYDFGCAIKKSIIYLNACEEESEVNFPFLNEDLIDYFEKREVIDYDFPRLINKLSIRKYLNENLNFDKVSPKKGIFKPTYFEFKLDKRQFDLAKKMNIETNKLNKMQISDYYLWSKYIIDNKIDLMY